MSHLQKTATGLLFFCGCLFATRALEVSSGKIKLILHEDIGRFSLYYLTDAESSKYTPLFTDQDPRTSTLSVAVNNRVYRLGDSFSFKETLTETDSGAKFTWKSSQLEVVQEFSFLRSLTSTEDDGVKITLTLTNLSEEDLEVGARFILDTNLGEAESVHFKDDTGSRITKETKYDQSSMPYYFVSPKDDEVGLMVLTEDPGVTTPDLLLFANWKRLNDTSWSYSTSSERTFNLPPYSINDSAACLYYFPQEIISGLSAQIVMAMGNFSETGYVLKALSSSAKTSAGSTTTTTTNDTSGQKTGSSGNAATETVTTVAIKGDIATLETVLEEIDKKIASGNYTEKDIELLEKIIAELKKKTGNYTQAQ